METPEFTTAVQGLEYKSVGDQWQVEGYVATYGETDRVNDVLLPGAFTQSLASGRKTRLLFLHQRDQILGAPLEVKDDSHGLFGRFRISKTPLGEYVYQLVKDTVLDSFSIGFIAREKEYTAEGKRLLKRLDRFEDSIVDEPADPRAAILSVKTPTPLPGFSSFWGTPPGFEDWLKAEVQRHLETHADTLPFDPAEMPFDQAWERITNSLTSGVTQAKALVTRRREEGRALPERHTQAIQTALRALEGASVELHALLHTPSSPAPTSTEPAAEAKAAPSSPLRDKIAAGRQRLESSVAQPA